jgi:hypothetical protein
MDGASQERVQVVIRIRPLNGQVADFVERFPFRLSSLIANRKEQERGEQISVTAEESRNEIKTVNSKASPQIWTFDSVFGLSTQQVM